MKDPGTIQSGGGETRPILKVPVSPFRVKRVIIPVSPFRGRRVVRRPVSPFGGRRTVSHSALIPYAYSHPHNDDQRRPRPFADQHAHPSSPTKRRRLNSLMVHSETPKVSSQNSSGRFRSPMDFVPISPFSAQPSTSPHIGCSTHPAASNHNFLRNFRSAIGFVPISPLWARPKASSCFAPQTRLVTTNHNFSGNLRSPIDQLLIPPFSVHPATSTHIGSLTMQPHLSRNGRLSAILNHEHPHVPATVAGGVDQDMAADKGMALDERGEQLGIYPPPISEMLPETVSEVGNQLNDVSRERCTSPVIDESRIALTTLEPDVNGPAGPVMRNWLRQLSHPGCTAPAVGTALTTLESDVHQPRVPEMQNRLPQVSPQESISPLVSEHRPTLPTLEPDVNHPSLYPSPFTCPIRAPQGGASCHPHLQEPPLDQQLPHYFEAPWTPLENGTFR